MKSSPVAGRIDILAAFHGEHFVDFQKTDSRVAHHLFDLFFGDLRLELEENDVVNHEGNVLGAWPIDARSFRARSRPWVGRMDIDLETVRISFCHKRGKLYSAFSASDEDPHVILGLTATIGLLPQIVVAQSAPINNNLASNGVFEAFSQGDDLWDGVDNDGYLAGVRGQATGLGEGGNLTGLAMPVSVQVADLITTGCRIFLPSTRAATTGFISMSERRRSRNSPTAN